MILDIAKFDEGRDALLFQPDSSDAYDYIFTLHRKGFAEPERGLLLAVLEDALRCLKQYAHAKDAQGEKLFREAEEWLLDEDEDWIFSFSSICEVLGLNRSYIRKQAASWKQETLASRPNTSGFMEGSSRGAVRPLKKPPRRSMHLF